MGKTKGSEGLEIHLRIDPDFRRDIDKFCGKQQCPPSAPAAIKYLAKLGLALSKRSDPGAAA
jgi:hypothetical protein